MTKVPSHDFLIDDDANRRYFLIGWDPKAKPPKDGYRMLLVLPGGSGSADFNGFFAQNLEKTSSVRTMYWCKLSHRSGARNRPSHWFGLPSAIPLQR